jgi:CheY-like chemotaxis protein
MKKVLSGVAVPRHSLFTMVNGSFVVQWDESRVQDLLTGAYCEYRYEDMGHPITDYELNQLKSAGRVEHFNRSYVWLYALPEAGRFSYLKILQHSHGYVRRYYLNTMLLPADLSQAKHAMEGAHLMGKYAPYVRGEHIAIGDKDGMLFQTLEAAENAQRQLQNAVSATLGDLVVAFVEVKQQVKSLEHEFEPDNNEDDLATIIASQTDTGVTRGRRVIVAGGGAEDRQSIVALCRDLEMDVHQSDSGGDTLRLLEDDTPPDLLVMDMQLPDMHGWELLAKLREIVDFHQFRVIVIAPPSSAQNEQTLALGVAKVDVYLVKPISLARLRQNIWMALKDQTTR